jgi:hypothetical protein
MKLIKINTDHYIVVDNSLDFSETDYYWDDKQKEIRTGSNNHVTGGYKIKITHSTLPIEIIYTSGVTMTNPPMGFINIIELPLSEVKELLGEVDVEKMAEEALISHPDFKAEGCSDYQNGRFNGIIEGYNQCLEDNKEKKYTEEDVGKIFYVGVQLGINQELYAQLGKPLQNEEEVLDRIIKSLQPKTEWEVEFINGKLTLKQ